MTDGVSIDVAVVQLVEPPIVIRKVTGSNPVGHPFNEEIMKAILDLTKDSRNLFAGRKNGVDYQPQVEGDGYLEIIVNDTQVVVASFMLGLLDSHRFQSIHISNNPYKNTHHDEIRRAIIRYSDY